MANIQDEIKAFEEMRSDLESRCLGQWVLVHDQKLIHVYDSFELAANDAVGQFGRGPYLIRQVGAEPLTLPVSVLYHLPDAGH